MLCDTIERTAPLTLSDATVSAVLLQNILQAGRGGRDGVSCFTQLIHYPHLRCASTALSAYFYLIVG